MRSVGSRPRKHDADRRALLIVSQRAQEGVDRQVEPARHGALHEVEAPVKEHHVSVRRQYVDVVWLHHLVILGCQHRHGRLARE